MKKMVEQSGSEARAAVRAFSLIEFIGVLAILAIIAALLLPMMIKRYDRAAWVKETNDMGAISNALVLQIIRNKTIPGAANDQWAKVAADWTMRPVSQITTNNRRFNRVYLIDPTLQIAGAGLPYVQSTNGCAGLPVNARVMLVSTIAGPGLPLISGVASSAAVFNDIWNTPRGKKPSTLSWNGRGDDLVIQRINFLPLFHQLILVNKDETTTAAFTIDSKPTPPIVVPPRYGWGWDRYYLETTQVGLVNTSSTNILQNSHLIKRSISFVFENGNWLPGLNTGIPTNSTLAAAFARTAANFMASMLNQDALSHANSQVDQRAAVGSMLNFMLAWTMWANDTPHFKNFNVTGPNFPSKLMIWTLLDREGVGDNPQYKGNIRYFTGDQTGLLQCDK